MVRGPHKPVPIKRRISQIWTDRQLARLLAIFDQMPQPSTVDMERIYWDLTELSPGRAFTYEFTR